MCLRRRPDLTRAEFLDYWENKHAPFFMANAATMRAKKYVQSQTMDSPMNEGFRESRGLQPDYDGVAEVWFESEQAGELLHLLTFDQKSVCEILLDLGV